MAAVALAGVLAVTGTVAAGDGVEDWVDSYRAFYRGLHGDSAAAARDFAALGESRRKPEFFREAAREAMQAREFGLAAQYAARWFAFGGGAKARLRRAEALLYGGKWTPAEAEFAALLRDKALSDADLYGYLRRAPGKESVAAGGRLFSLNAAGQEYLARLAFAAGDFATAENAVKAGLAAGGERAILHFLRAQVAAAKDGAAGVARALREYIAAGCPGVSEEGACAEAPVFYAYRRLFASIPQWDAPLQSPAEYIQQSAVAAAELWEQAGDPARARAYYDRHRGDYFPALFGIARMENRAGNKAAALQLLDKAKVEDDAQFALREVTAAAIIGELFGGGKKLERLAEARKVAPDNYRLLYDHSLAAEETGDLHGALRLLEKMTRLYPGDAHAWNALGYVLADNKMQLANAEIYIKRAMSLRADDPNIIDSLGWLYYRQGKLAEAQVLLAHAARVSGAAEIAAHLGEVLWERGERKQAREVWKAALARHPKNKVLLETLARYRPFGE